MVKRRISKEVDNNMSEEWTPNHEHFAWLISFIPLIIVSLIITIPFLLGYTVDPFGVVIGLCFGTGFVIMNFLRLKKLKKEYGIEDKN